MTNLERCLEGRDYWEAIDPNNEHVTKLVQALKEAKEHLTDPFDFDEAIHNGKFWLKAQEKRFAEFGTGEVKDGDNEYTDEMKRQEEYDAEHGE